MLYVILIILLILLLLLLLELFLFSKIEIHFKDKLLTVAIKTPLYRKVIRRDLNQTEAEPQKNGAASDETSEKSPISDKIADIKKRVFNPDTGFDTEEVKKVWGELSETHSYVFGILKKLLVRLRHKIHINKLFIRLEYGTDNPAATGIIYGSVWNLVGLVYPFLTMYFRIAYPTLDITPDFYSKRFDIEVKSIIKVRAAHIINAGLSLLLVPTITYFKDKSKKGRENNGR